MLKKTDFTPFKVGTIFNPPRNHLAEIKPLYKKISILYPSRLNAMALDPSKVTVNHNMQYSPGEIIFKVKIYKKISVEILNDTHKIYISENSKRKPLIKHSALIMRKALKFKNGLKIDVDNENEIKHVGLGSSSGLIASVACAINELYDKPIKRDDLLQYLAQNHGEEINNHDDMLSPVQCIGGSAAAGLFDGGMIVLAGKSRVIASMKIDGNYKAVIGIPKDFKELDAQTLLYRETKIFDKVIECGKKFGNSIAYNCLHNVLPAMAEGDISAIGDFIFDYRYNMGSIAYCSYTYDKLLSIAKKVAFLKRKGIVDILSISSVGPAFFAITKNYKTCKENFENVNLKTYIADIENDTYKILKTIKK